MLFNNSENFSSSLRVVLSILAPSFLRPLWDERASQPRQLYATSYLTGLRGVAAFCVYIGHFSLPFQQPSIQYGYGLGDNHSLFQLPILRLFYTGSPMVAIFFVISGFALSLKPMMHIHRRAWDRLLCTVASSVLRRWIRLFLPCLVSTFVVVICVRMHLFEMSFDDVPGALRPMRPIYQENLRLQLLDWGHWVFNYLTNLWEWQAFHPPSNYGGHLWTISFEFRSSMLLFTTLIGLSRMAPTYFFVVSISLIFYSLIWGKWDLAGFLSGMTLAKVDLIPSQAVFMSYESASSERRKDQYLFLTLEWLAFIGGLYCASFPETLGDKTPGYSWLAAIFSSHHQWQWAGAVLIVWSLSKVNLLQTILTTSFIQYMGEISFALYIVHEPLLQMFGWSIVPGLWKITGNTNWFSYQLGFFTGFVLLTPVIIWISDIFMRVVDHPSLKLARWAEGELLCVDDAE